jgi:hypothetical protein
MCVFTLSQDPSVRVAVNPLLVRAVFQVGRNGAAIRFDVNDVVGVLGTLDQVQKRLDEGLNAEMLAEDGLVAKAAGH